MITFGKKALGPSFWGFLRTKTHIQDWKPSTGQTAGEMPRHGTSQPKNEPGPPLSGPLPAAKAEGVEHERGTRRVPARQPASTAGKPKRGQAGKRKAKRHSAGANHPGAQGRDAGKGSSSRH